MFCSNWFCVFLSFLVKLNAANVLFASIVYVYWCVCVPFYCHNKPVCAGSLIILSSVILYTAFNVCLINVDEVAK